MEVRPLAKLEAIDLLVDSGKYKRKSSNPGPNRIRRLIHIFSLILIALLKLALFVVIVYFFWHAFTHTLNSKKFNLSEIKIEGIKYLDPKPLETAVRTEFPKNLMQIDLKQIQERAELQDWVLRAEVRRQLPDTLRISVVERTPRAMALLSGGLVVIDRDGVVLEKYHPKFGKFDLPIIKGLVPPHRENSLERNKSRADLFFNIIGELDRDMKNYSKKISEIDVSNVEDAILLLMNETTPIHLGNKHFLRRFQTLLSNMTEYQNLKERYGGLESVDLRFENQIVCRTAKKL